MIAEKMKEIDDSLAEYFRLIEDEIDQLKLDKHPKELYEPINYILQLGGKKLRPILTLLAYSLYRTDYQSIVKYALAVEVFHNFTLMHDDIMDQAPLRRGKKTVHEKWNDNIAILSGDVMLVKAYELFLDLDPSKLQPVLRSFSECAARVCEGQQIDMNFETIERVTEASYIEMIKLKTAILLGFALELGAILADASKKDQHLLQLFGENVGIGFQLKDDLLDIYADQTKFGKQVGGDIISNKKTFLLIKALELAEGEVAKELNYWIQRERFDSSDKVTAVKNIYDQLQIKALTVEKMDFYFRQGFDALRKVNLPEDKKTFLKQFAEQLIDREK
jgi:geranylgeranyl diphosphate synthase, type II